MVQIPFRDTCLTVFLTAGRVHPYEDIEYIDIAIVLLSSQYASKRINQYQDDPPGRVG